ncbi:MAG: serine hydroxymethyltransferase [Deltaproteobacteria bacterium CG11_big_fil_rev_8_21_14_0_20_45_16]|nr:MAG: serine hydroxymethyltransferase [Deltaproteobacteria bacterium CG11_big_fil_rev_8_21_14_0_20_45_16]
MIKASEDIFKLILKEEERELTQLELIASENFVSEHVRAAMGSVLTNKYAEGYPGKRYYGGCEVVDEIESLARERLKKLFGAEEVNVQPHSGSQANMAVYFSFLEPGDCILSMDLSQGGHLTHGASVNFSGKLYRVVHYGVDSKGYLDFNQVRELALKEKPKLIVCGASSYSRQIPFEEFRKIADEVGARVLADMAHPAGLVATGCHPSPVPYCEYVTSTTHKTLRGPRGGVILMKEDVAKSVNSRIFPGIQGGPLMHVIAAKAIAFGEALEPGFKTYCEQVIKNAKTLAKTLQDAGLEIISGGTDNHLMMVDLRAYSVTGLDAENALGQAGMTVNKNMIPGDPQAARITSGIRLGSPALTTRGFKEEHMKQVGSWIVGILKNIGDESLKVRTRAEIREFVKSFPLFQS